MENVKVNHALVIKINDSLQFRFTEIKILWNTNSKLYLLHSRTGQTKMY